MSGESYKYLGKQYRLELNLTSSIERVLLDEDKLKLFVRNKNKSTTKARLIDEWYRNQAKMIFYESLEKIYELIKEQVKTIPTIDFKIMRKRWGSCLRTKHVILLNLELIKAPKYCIDYVVLHELIHFVHKNHDSKFYELLTVLMPDWKQRKEILDQEIVLYI
jgi:predicted metal-dependent hydrolase